MKKIASLILSLCVIGGAGSVYGQNITDAYRLSQHDINGTARYLSMGGAFGALGGDISSMHTNPAGLGIYRSSEMVTTVSLNMVNANANWLGNKEGMNKTNFLLDNFAYVGYFPTGNDEGIVSWNVGLSYNKLKNFNRRFKMRGNPGMSISDYIAAYTTTDPDGLSFSDIEKAGDYPYDSRYNLPWMSVLGAYGGLIDNIGGKEWDSDMGYFDNKGDWQPYGIQDAQLEMYERGGIDQYNFSFATNISNIVFIGATLGVSDISYRLSAYYDEDFGRPNNLVYDNFFRIDGSGVNVNVGVIVRPTDYLRLGVAYNSPTWYRLTNEFEAEASSYNDKRNGADPAWNEYTDRGFFDYKLTSADKWIFSAAGIIGTKGLISVDYEMSNFSRMKFHYEDGGEYPMNKDQIERDYQTANTLRVGAEYRVTPQFTVRAGGAWQSSATKEHFQENMYEFIPDFTLPHYTVDRGMASYSVGLGYRFTSHFYMDMAYVYRQRKDNAYVFSNIGGYDLDSTPAELKTNTSRVALTFGYKF